MTPGTQVKTPRRFSIVWPNIILVIAVWIPVWFYSVHQVQAQTGGTAPWKTQRMRPDDFTECLILTQGGNAVGISCYRRYQ